MIRLHHQRARDYFAAHEATIDAGASHLAEAFAIEATETVAKMIPGTLADGMAKRRVEAALKPRIEDFLEGLHALDDGPAYQAKANAMDSQSIATIGAVAIPVLWVLSKLPWGKWAEGVIARLKTPSGPPAVNNNPSPTDPGVPPEILLEAQLIPGDWAALQRLIARATRKGNATMYEHLAAVEEEFWNEGDGWEEEAAE